MPTGRNSRNQESETRHFNKIKVFWDMMPCSSVNNTNISKEPAAVTSGLKIEATGSSKKLVPI
jgi:hypothetical protein